MSAWVMLLRGINVGGHGKLKMADLRTLLTDLGAANVASYIQSGNVVFTGAFDAGFAARVTDEIERRHGFRPRVLMRARETFADIAAAFPFTDAAADPKTSHIWFLAEPSGTRIDDLSPLASPTERLHLTEHALYLFAPDGIGRSKLAEKAERLLGVPATARNLNTVHRVLRLAEALPEG